MLDLMKEGLSRPDKIVNIRNIPGLDKILFDSKKGLTIGPNVTLADMEADRVIKENYFALFLAVGSCGNTSITQHGYYGWKSGTAYPMLVFS